MEVVANRKAVTSADVDLPAKIMRNPARHERQGVLEETSATCVAWSGVMPGRKFRNNHGLWTKCEVHNLAEKPE